ncbi:hypothetical protein, partial [Cohaesibacter celericrescens]|uniref:hypothetical protein n=1 Tax=Cohaesibacter celericrescens TaxID=2067669 RepID=UPI003567B799
VCFEPVNLDVSPCVITVRIFFKPRHAFGVMLIALITAPVDCTPRTARVVPSNLRSAQMTLNRSRSGPVKSPMTGVPPALRSMPVVV